MAQNGVRDHGDRQDTELNERRAIRRDYREKISRLNRERSDLIRPESEGLNDYLEEATELFGRIRRIANVAPTTEAALDAQLLKAASNLGCQKAKKLHVDNKFDANVFMEKLVTFMHGRTLRNMNETEIDEDGWSFLSKEAAPAFRRAPGFHFMYGTFEREQPKKKRPTVAKNAEEPAGPAVVPEKVKTMGKGHQEVTTEEVERMVGILHEVTRNGDDIEPVSYFDFVINPDSFSQTVENIFHLSFVLKDGHAKIYHDDDGLPVIVPAKPHTEERSGDRVTRKQVLVSIDMDQWQELIRVFEIKEPLIPTRKSAKNGQH